MGFAAAIALTATATKAVTHFAFAAAMLGAAWMSALSVLVLLSSPKIKRLFPQQDEPPGLTHAPKGSIARGILAFYSWASLLFVFAGVLFLARALTEFDSVAGWSLFCLIIGICVSAQLCWFLLFEVLHED